jgi:hypothetical protein
MVHRVRRALLPSSLFPRAVAVGLLAIAAGIMASTASAQHGGGHAGGFGGGHAGGGMSGGHPAPAVTPHAAPVHAVAPPPGPSNSGSNVARQQNQARPLILPNTVAAPDGGAASRAESSAGPTREVIGFPRSSQRWANVDPQRAGPGWRTITPGGEPGSGWTYSPVQGGARAPIRISGQGHQLWLSEPETDTRGFASAAPLVNSARPPHKIPPRAFPPLNGGFGPGFFPGFGFGFFGGFGLGFSDFGCDPFGGYGCDAFGYDSYYLPYYGFGSPPAPSEPNPAEEQPEPSSSYTVPYSYEPPPGPQEPSSQSNESNETVLFLTNGQVHMITSYWLANGQLHYETGDGIENIIDLTQVDLQSTVNANAARGITFTLRPSPEMPPDQNQNQGAASAPPGAQNPNPQR